MIISVGYHVKSERGVQFRIWANKVLKDYLLKGHAINQRFEKIEGDVWQLKNKVDEIDFQIIPFYKHIYPKKTCGIMPIDV